MCRQGASAVLFKAWCIVAAVIAVNLTESFGRDVTTAEIIAAAADNRSRLENAEMELDVVLGEPATQETTDRLRVAWAGESCLQQLLARSIIRNNMPYDRLFQRRVSSYTSQFLFVIERASDDAPWRVSHTMTAAEKPLEDSTKFNRVDQWRKLTAAVDGISIETLLRAEHDVKIFVSANNEKLTVKLKPGDGVFFYPVADLELILAMPSFTVIGSRHVYTARPPGGEPQHHRVEYVGTDLREWQAGVWYPKSILQSSFQISEPRLDAEIVKPNVSSTAHITALRVGHVESDAFLPSAFGLPNHIVGLDMPGRRWNPWLVALVVANLIAIGGWMFFRFRRRRAVG